MCAFRVTVPSGLYTLVFVVTSVCFLSSKKAVSWPFLWFPAGAVVSSKGERGKPSRDTSERREQRELEILWSLSSFKWKQLHSPPPRILSPRSLSTSPLSPLFLSHFSHHHCTSPPLRFLWFSVLPCSWQVKGTLRSYWLHNRLLIPLFSKKNK